jgi:hypothetical protein
MIDITKIKELEKEQKKRERDIKKLQRDREKLLRKYEIELKKKNNISVKDNIYTNKTLAIEYPEKSEKKTRTRKEEIKQGVIRQPKKDSRYDPLKGNKTNKTLEEETYEVEEIIRQIRENPEDIERIDFGRSMFGVITRKY